MTKTKIKHNAHALALGHLVAGFQHLESELLRIVIDCNMPGDQRAVSILAGQLSFLNLVATLPALVDTLSQDENLKKRTRKLSKQLAIINSERNTFMHSHYHLMQWDMKGESLLRRKIRVDIKNGIRETEKWFNPEDVEKLIEKMGIQCKELHDIEWKLIEEGIIPAFDDTQQI